MEDVFRKNWLSFGGWLQKNGLENILSVWLELENALKTHQKSPPQSTHRKSAYTAAKSPHKHQIQKITPIKTLIKDQHLIIQLIGHPQITMNMKTGGMEERERERAGKVDDLQWLIVERED